MSPVFWMHVISIAIVLGLALFVAIAILLLVEDTHR